MTNKQREARKEQRKVWFERFKGFWKETGVYFAAILGVFLSRYVGPYRSGEPFSVVFSATEVVGAITGGVAIQAFILDRGGTGEPGKRARWKARAGQAFLGGIAIDYIIGKVFG